MGHISRFNQVQGVSDDVGDTRELRKGLVWPLLSLALLCTVIFVVISIGTYECVAYGHADCDAVTCCVTPCAVFIAVVTWLFAAMAVSMSGESKRRTPQCGPSTKRHFNAKSRVRVLVVRWAKYVALKQYSGVPEDVLSVCKLGAGE